MVIFHSYLILPEGTPIKMAILGVSPNFHSGIAMAGLTSLQRLAVPCCGCCDGDGAAGASAEAGDPKRSSGCEIPIYNVFTINWVCLKMSCTPKPNG